MLKFITFLFINMMVFGSTLTTQAMTFKWHETSNTNNDFTINGTLSVDDNLVQGGNLLIAFADVDYFEWIVTRDFDNTVIFDMSGDPGDFYEAINAIQINDDKMSIDYLFAHIIETNGWLSWYQTEEAPEFPGWWNVNSPDIYMTGWGEWNPVPEPTTMLLLGFGLLGLAGLRKKFKK